jgi:PPOX class probable F420-dependent enzyme
MDSTKLLLKHKCPMSTRPHKSSGHAAAKKIPASHCNLIDGAYMVALSTVMPDGQPHTTPVWLNRRGEFLYVNVMKGFRKEKNMRANPRVTLLAYDPRNPCRNIEIRGCVVEMTEEGAREHNDELTRLYLNKADAKFFGDAVPRELETKYTPIRVKIAPTHVRVEGKK